MKKITGFVAAAILFAFSQTSNAQNIVINEILTSNSTINTDEDGDYQDWVELYNNGPASVNLNGYGLTDDSSLPFKWVFPNVTVASGQYLLIYCSDKNRTTPGNPLHTNFKISASGEVITLSKPDGTIKDQVPATAIPEDISYGRSPNGTGSFAFFNVATPGAANNSSGYSGILSAPQFSQNGGFYTSAFDLTLTSSDPGATILYTLDGSEPDENNIGGTTYTYKMSYPEEGGQPYGPLFTNSFETLQYSGPINIINRSPQPNKVSAISSTYSFDPSYYIPPTPIFKGTVVRSKVVKPGALASPVVTQTYFISPQGTSRFSLPVVSLSFSENKFFDYNEGIYVAGVDYDTWRAANPTLNPRGREVGNYYRRGQENERRANFSFFVNGNEVLNQDVGLRIRGASTRRYESKALTVYARSEYGDGKLNYQFFPDLDDDAFDRLTLSNSGSDFRNTMFRDALVHEICKHMKVENENYRPAITFFNGEYWGILNLRERFDNNYFKRVYNIDEVDLLENRGEDAEEGDTVHYEAMVNFVETNSLAVPANYDYIKTQLDPESFTDYFITNIYMDNSDWPNNNVMFWRKKTPSYQPNAPYGHDGRWRWIFHDLDDTFSFGTDDFNHDNLTIATTVNEEGVNPEWSTLLLRKMLENGSYKNDFINRFADLMNTTFLPARIISIMNQMSSAIQSSMPEHIARWRLPSSVGSWNWYLNYQKDFANQRPQFQREHIKNRFNIDNTINVTINVSAESHGHVKINTIDIAEGTPGITANPYPWSGVYFSNIPVKLKAIAKQGFVFSHWTGASTSTDPEIVVTSANSFSVTAVFVSAEPVQISEPVYFWMMNSSIPNDTPLTTLNSTYELLSDAVLQFQSSFAGYPFTSSHPNWRKGSMERRNSPTPLNYRPEANSGAAYNASAMRGLQITQPFKNGELENTMIFNLSTAGFKDIKFSFAVKDEGAATGIILDYSINSGTPVWITTGMPATTFPINNTYQTIQADFSTIASTMNNPNFKIRLRFTGPNMTADNGGRVTFNNIALDGVRMPLIYPTPHVFTAGTAITPIVPTVSGGTVLSFAVSPSLPAGLSLNATTGIISGTPTTASAAASYTVTATYSGGTASSSLSIAISPAAPANLSYNSPNTFTVGTAISPLNPTSTGGSVATYSVSPALPAGLSLNANTGVISGTPTGISATGTYTVTATNPGGSTSFDIVITINDAAPTSLSYATPNIFTLGTAITPLSPSISGGSVTSYSISPALPAGLSFNTTTGVISGTPGAVTAAATYTVTANNSGGSATFAISITINDAAPAGLTYTSPNTFTKGIAISPLVPTVSGGTVVSFSVSPSLPAGLSLNTTTGVISGTPTAVTSSSPYTVTASNSGGNISFNVIIAVNDPAPSGLSYTTPNILTVGTAVTLNPTITGGGTFSVSPALPAGLTLNANTGVISGTPTTETATSIYTVTVTNSGGTATFAVTITVNDIAPAGLSYSSPNVFTVGVEIVALIPTVSGGSVDSYSISPALPPGLTLNTSTGEISGTPTTIATTSSYTVTASNTGGTTTFALSITVNAPAPAALSYPSPNILVVGIPIASLTPTVSGGLPTSYSVSPSLPIGLSLNTSTGVISGTPTTVSSTATYVVTATNTGGSTSFNVVITVNAPAPAGLSYNSPNIYTVGTTIAPLTPAIEGSGFTFTVTPSLPAGLTLNSGTGTISGTPTAVVPTSSFTVTATNTGGSASFDIIITVNNIAPSGLAYNSPNIFTKGSAITPLTPTISGGAVVSYSVSPALPGGLNLNTTTGTISGTPTVLASTATYVVSAQNSGGTATFGIVITVNDVAPSGLSYNSPNVFTVGTAIVPLTPTISGNATGYSVSPTLPAGLILNTSTGVISGTPTAVAATSSFTVTATNSGGSTSYPVTITVNDAAPTGLSYNSPNIYTVGIAIANLHPTVTGNITSYSVSPALPQGLTLNTTTGNISGTPTQVTPPTTFTVTATNSGGSISFGVVITVKDVAPSGLAYNSPNVFTAGAAISALVPTISGSATGYSVSPNLPSGLTLNALTGVISGTPTVVTPTSVYVVTATNTGGSTSFNLVITVNAAAPTGLSYTTPNVFTVGTSIGDLSPSVTGNVVSYSVTPSLPNGLTLNAATGVISGTPTIVTSTASYTITATNSGGSTSFAVVITVKDVTPSALGYNSPNVFTVGQEAGTLLPTITGNNVVFSVSPALPAGLSLNASTGAISGTPTSPVPTATYTVTASNSGGSTTFGIVITVNETPPASLVYSTPNLFTIGQAILPLSPTVNGSVTSYSISPSLPTGLTLNTSTGVISGTATALSTASNYTVTATNTGGTASFVISIAVIDVAPINLSYNTPNIFTINVPITPLVPTVAGNVTSYSIFPSLPAGLTLNTSTGVISGTPTVLAQVSSHTITASNSGGSVSFDVAITIADVAPTGLSYPSPLIFAAGTPITPLVPTITGNTTGYTVTPLLPAGLTMNLLTGVISGTPTSITPTETYTVTATNSGGNATFNLIITVTAAPPTALSYTTPNVFIAGSPITALTPSVTGNVVNYSVSPSLPAGLSINNATGIISGTPTTATATLSYVVTATNSGGSTTFGVVITINPAAPSNLTYSASNVFTVNNAITPLAPTVSGTGLTFTVTPGLPSGLSIDPATGVISGTPTSVTATATYTVTATNISGSTSFGITITVNDIAPANLVYPTPNVFTLGSEIMAITPMVQGNVTSYAIVPALPPGLSLNPITGTISGTPTVFSTPVTYTVTATNTGGNATFNLSIEVVHAAPLALSYTTPNNLTVNDPIIPMMPSVTGTVTSYAVVPALPAGLTIDPVTGVISGTPTQVSPLSTYIVTASNSGGSVSFELQISVSEELGTIDNSLSNVRIYPNPFVDYVQLSGFDAEPSYELFSIDGKLVRNGKSLNGRITLEQLADGVYVLHLNHNGKTIVRKIIKDGN